MHSAGQSMLRIQGLSVRCSIAWARTQRTCLPLQTSPMNEERQHSLQNSTDSCRPDETIFERASRDQAECDSAVLNKNLPIQFVLYGAALKDDLRCSNQRQSTVLETSDGCNTDSH